MPLSEAGAVRKALLALSELSGQGVERLKTARLGALLRAAEGATTWAGLMVEKPYKNGGLMVL